MEQEQPPSPSHKKKKAPYSFRSHIPRLLKQFHPTIGITSKANDQLDQILVNLAIKFSSVVRELNLQANVKTIGAKNIQNAVLIVFETDKSIQDELTKHALNYGTKAVLKFNSREGIRSPLPGKEKKKINNGRKRFTKADRSGLLFRPTLAEKYLRHFGIACVKISQQASIYLAGVLEYIAGEILDTTSRNLTDDKKRRITVRYLFKAIEHDEELHHIIKTQLLGGGVLPHIHKALLRRKDKTKRDKPKKSITDKNHTGGIIKPHRFRPGTVALRNIRRYQKSGGLLIQHAVIERIIRSITKEYKTDVRFAAGVMEMMQYFAEQETVKMLYKANLLSIHAKRQTLHAKDIRTALAVMDNIPLMELYDSDLLRSNPIPHPALDRLCFRAGNKRRGVVVYPEITLYIFRVLSNLIRIMVRILTNNKGKTMTTKILAEAGRLNGTPMAVYEVKTK